MYSLGASKPTNGGGDWCDNISTFAAGFLLHSLTAQRFGRVLAAQWGLALVLFVAMKFMPNGDGHDSTG